MLLGYLTIRPVLFVQCKVLFLFAVIVRRFIDLENLFLIFDCPLEITLFGIGGRKRVNDARIFPFG